MTMIARKTFLRKLKAVAPALGGHHGDPILTHFWFTGHRVMASNGRITISVPCTTKFKGAVPGKFLLGLIKVATFAAGVELRADGANAVQVKLGHNRTELPTLPLGEFPLADIPVPTGSCISRIAGRFFAGVEHCLQSVHDHAILPDQQGVTLIADENAFQLFAPDMRYSAIGRELVGISHSKLPPPKGLRLDQRRVILSASFCREMLRLASRTTYAWLAIGDGHAVFVADDVLLYGRLVVTDEPLDFEGILQRVLPRGWENALVPVAKSKLGRVFKRACLITDIKGNELPTEISIRDGMATFRSQSRRAEILDPVKLFGHPDVETRVCVPLLPKAGASFDRVLFTDQIVVMANGHLLYLAGVPAQ